MTYEHDPALSATSKILKTGKEGQLLLIEHEGGKSYSIRYYSLKLKKWSTLEDHETLERATQSFRSFGG